MANSGKNQIETKIKWPTLSCLPVPMKVLLSAILITLSLGMIGALGQIIVHDIIPTFFAKEIGPQDIEEMEDTAPGLNEKRGDLFSDSSMENTGEDHGSDIDKERFVWTLRWTHIHLFGMSMIFIFLGAVTVFLDISIKARSWLVALPFVGVVIDIAAMWLKAFVSPMFFWLHIPGGGLFAVIFFFIFFRGMIEMWSTGSHET